jgi:hypothetical protein
MSQSSPFLSKGTDLFSITHHSPFHRLVFALDTVGANKHVIDSDHKHTFLAHGTVKYTASITRKFLATATAIVFQAMRTMESFKTITAVVVEPHRTRNRITIRKGHTFVTCLTTALEARSNQKLVFKSIALWTSE